MTALPTAATAATAGAALPARDRLRGALGAGVRAAERGFAFFALVVLSEAFLPLLAGGDAAAVDAQAASPLRTMVLAAVYAGTLLVAALRAGDVARAALRNPLVPALVLLAGASSLWSDLPGLTLKRALLLGATTLFGLWLAARFPRRELLGLLAGALAVTAVLSLAAGALAPAIGTDPEFDGAWRGVYGHKNGLGKAMALTALVALAAGRGGWWRLLLPLAALLVLLSRSTSALIALAAVVALVPLLRALRARSVLAVLGAMAVVAALAVAAGGTGAGIGTLFTALGKDATLTGRTELWSAVLASIEKRSVLGYGYGAFWHASAESESVFAAVGWGAWHAHNAVLDVWLHLGVVGVLCFAGACAWATGRALGELRAGSGADAVWPLAFLAFLFLSNLTESRILEPNTLYWALFVAVACALPEAGAVPAAAAPRSAPLSPGVRLRHRRRAAAARVVR